MNTVVLEHCCILALQLALEHFGIVDGGHWNIAVLGHWNTVDLEHCCKLAEEHLCIPDEEPGWRLFHIVALELNCIVVLEQSYTPPLGHSDTVVWEHWSTVALERCYTLDGECCCRPPLQLFLGLGYIVEMEHFGTLALEQS